MQDNGATIDLISPCPEDIPIERKRKFVEIGIDVKGIE